MKFTDRKDFLTDPEVFGLQDTQTALRIYNEWCTKHSARPAPNFLEVNKSTTLVDDLWHQPTGPIQFTRQIEIPCLNVFQKPDWRLTRIGIVANRQDTFIIAYNTLKELDYFPERGDRVAWNGYNYMILKVVLDPSAYWQQTNQWMGLNVECVVPPDGDSRPVLGNIEQTQIVSPAFHKLNRHTEA